MPLCAALATALVLGAPPAAPVAALSHAFVRRAPDLTLHLVGRLPSAPGVDAVQVDARSADPPPCVGDVCQPVVAVPGFEPRFQRASRSELLVLALQRARVEPVATLAWTLVATGIRLDWSPPVLEGNAHAHGWGSVMLRVRVRVDAENRVVFPRRPRSS